MRDNGKVLVNKGKLREIFVAARIVAGIKDEDIVDLNDRIGELEATIDDANWDIENLEAQVEAAEVEIGRLSENLSST